MPNSSWTNCGHNRYFDYTNFNTAASVRSSIPMAGKSDQLRARAELNSRLRTRFLPAENSVTISYCSVSSDADVRVSLNELERTRGRLFGIELKWPSLVYPEGVRHRPKNFDCFSYISVIVLSSSTFCAIFGRKDKDEQLSKDLVAFVLSSRNSFVTGSRGHAGKLWQEFSLIFPRMYDLSLLLDALPGVVPRNVSHAVTLLLGESNMKKIAIPMDNHKWDAYPLHVYQLFYAAFDSWAAERVWNTLVSALEEVQPNLNQSKLNEFVIFFKAIVCEDCGMRFHSRRGLNDHRASCTGWETMTTSGSKMSMSLSNPARLVKEIEERRPTTGELSSDDGSTNGRGSEGGKRVSRVVSASDVIARPSGKKPARVPSASDLIARQKRRASISTAQEGVAQVLELKVDDDNARSLASRTPRLIGLEYPLSSVSPPLSAPPHGKVESDLNVSVSTSYPSWSTAAAVPSTSAIASAGISPTTANGVQRSARMSSPTAALAISAGSDLLSSSDANSAADIGLLSPSDASDVENGPFLRRQVPPSPVVKNLFLASPRGAEGTVRDDLDYWKGNPWEKDFSEFKQRRDAAKMASTVDSQEQESTAESDVRESSRAAGGQGKTLTAMLAAAAILGTDDDRDELRRARSRSRSRPSSRSRTRPGSRSSSHPPRGGGLVRSPSLTTLGGRKGKGTQLLTREEMEGTIQQQMDFLYGALQAKHKVFLGFCEQMVKSQEALIEALNQKLPESACEVLRAIYIPQVPPELYQPLPRLSSLADQADITDHSDERFSSSPRTSLGSTPTSPSSTGGTRVWRRKRSR